MSKRKRESPKRVWMLTYCPAGTYITFEMLKQHGLVADECHSTADQVMNYTFIHLTRRVRQTGIQAFLETVNQSHGIVLNEIFGYDPISSGSRAEDGPKIQDHVVFRMLLSHCKAQHQSFRPCTDGKPELTRGHLFNALDVVSTGTGCLELMTKKQLVAYATSLENDLKKARQQEVEASLREAEANSLISSLDVMTRESSTLRLENGTLKQRLAELESRLMHFIN
jgi:BMFP domain-containing protein YqiC